MEHKQGWASENNPRYVVLENGELARNRVQKPPQPRQEALAVERATGEKSAQRIAQERGHEIIKEAASWEELHEKLAARGLRFEKKGSGAIIFVGDKAVKASSVDRNFGMSKLCKRLGAFIPAPESIAGTESFPPIPPEPVSTVNIEEWHEYQAERHIAEGIVQNADKNRTKQEALKVWQREERQQILRGMGKRGLPALNKARHLLRVKHKKELRQLQQDIRLKKSKQRPNFDLWLRQRGLHSHADRWKYRKSLEPASLSQIAKEATVPHKTPEGQQCAEYITAVNADSVRVTCIRMEKDGSKKTFILDKVDGATKGFTSEEVQSHIPEMLRLQQRGENIYYTPLSEKRHHILIDDMTRESMEKLYEDGFRPAVVLESSPGNYQCVLTIPKLQSQHDRDVGNRITERLNRQYGDPKLSGCIHPHRAPAFDNLKPKHQREDGSFPKVRLLSAAKHECTKALALSRQIEREYVEAAKAKKQTQPAALHTGDTGKAYYAHYENIRKYLTVEDLSRVDAMIALRLRATGHSQEGVVAALCQCAPTIRQGSPKREGRDWQRYADRTAAYAFGVAGDVALMKHERYMEHWRGIEGIERAKMQDAQRVQMR